MVKEQKMRIVGKTTNFVEVVYMNTAIKMPCREIKYQSLQWTENSTNPERVPGLKTTKISKKKPTYFRNGL